jgi:hypothetical protein
VSTLLLVSIPYLHLHYPYHSMLICEFALCENRYHEWVAARTHHSIINAHSTHCPKHAYVEGKRDSMRTHFFTMGQEALLEAVLSVGEVKWPCKFFCSMRTLVREKPYCIKVPNLNLLLLLPLLLLLLPLLLLLLLLLPLLWRLLQLLTHKLLCAYRYLAGMCAYVMSMRRRSFASLPTETGSRLLTADSRPHTPP